MDIHESTEMHQIHEFLPGDYQRCFLLAYQDLCENFIFPLHNLNIVDLEFDLQMNFHIDISSSAFQLLHYYCLSLRISSAPAMKSSMLCTRPCPDYA